MANTKKKIKMPRLDRETFLSIRRHGIVDDKKKKFSKTACRKSKNQRFNNL